MIDYVIVNEKAEDITKRVVEGDRTESDHVPLEVELEGPGLHNQANGKLKQK